MVSFPQVSPSKPCIVYIILLSPIRATCPAHQIPLDLITRKIFGEQYKPLSSSVCSFLHSLVTSSLSGPNILLNAQFSNDITNVFTLLRQYSDMVTELDCVGTGTGGDERLVL
jgi:hypothetical protein